MSESLPYNGVEIVDVIRNAVVAHACSEKPPRSSAMVRIAVDTIVWSRAARNIAIMRPARIVMIWRCVSAVCSPATAGADVLKASLRLASRFDPSAFQNSRYSSIAGGARRPSPDPLETLVRGYDRKWEASKRGCDTGRQGS